MTSWTMLAWHGPPAVVEAALRALGWHAPGEEPPAGPPPGIGGVLPAPGTPVVVLDGTAHLAVVTRTPLADPPGLLPTDPADATALLGSF